MDAMAQLPDGPKGDPALTLPLDSAAGIILDY
jgi:hypothetical protein